MPDVNLLEVSRLLRDAVYVTVGVGVIAVQKAQVQRRELQGQLEESLADAKQRLEQIGDSVEDGLDSLEDQFEVLLDEVESRLPDQAATAVRQARDAAKEAQRQLRARGARGRCGRRRGGRRRLTAGGGGGAVAPPSRRGESGVNRLRVALDATSLLGHRAGVGVFTTRWCAGWPGSTTSTSGRSPSPGGAVTTSPMEASGGRDRRATDGGPPSPVAGGRPGGPESSAGRARSTWSTARTSWCRRRRPPGWPPCTT